MKRALLLAVLLLAFPASASAQFHLVPAHTTAGAGLAVYQGWSDAGGLPTPDLDVPIAFRNCTEYGADACTRGAPGHRYIVIADYSDLASDPRASDDDRLGAQLELLHEEGHVWDLSARNHGYRHTIERLLAITGSWWLGVAPASERFAMGFAYCSLFPSRIPRHVIRSVYWGYDYHPTVTQHRRMCAAIRRGAHLNGWTVARTQSPPPRASATSR